MADQLRDQRGRFTRRPRNRTTGRYIGIQDAQQLAAQAHPALGDQLGPLPQNEAVVQNEPPAAAAVVADQAGPLPQNEAVVQNEPPAAAAAAVADQAGPVGDLEPVAPAHGCLTFTRHRPKPTTKVDPKQACRKRLDFAQNPTPITATTNSTTTPAPSSSSSSSPLRLPGVRRVPMTSSLPPYKPQSPQDPKKNATSIGPASTAVVPPEQAKVVPRKTPTFIYGSWTRAIGPRSPKTKEHNPSPTKEDQVNKTNLGRQQGLTSTSTSSAGRAIPSVSKPKQRLTTTTSVSSNQRPVYNPPPLVAPNIRQPQQQRLLPPPNLSQNSVPLPARPRIPVLPRGPRPQHPPPPNEELRPHLPDNYNEMTPQQQQQESQHIFRQEQVVWNRLWLEWAAQLDRYNAQLRIWLAANPDQQ